MSKVKNVWVVLGACLFSLFFLFAVGCGDQSSDSSSQDKSDSATVTYTISDTEKDMALFETYVLYVYSNGEKTGAEWSSSNAKIASVDADGVVTANAMGTATVTAKVADETLTCVVTVGYAKKIPVLTMDKTEVVLLKGKSLTVTPSLTLEGETLSLPSDLEYVSSNDEAVSVSKNQDGSCLLKGLDLCENVKIDVICSWYEIPLTAEILVDVGEAVMISIDPTELILYTAQQEGQPVTGKVSLVSVTESDETVVSPSVVWASEEETVATIDQNGNVTAVGAGETYVTATYTSTSGKTYTASCSVIVNISVFDRTDGKITDVYLREVDGQNRVILSDHGIDMTENAEIYDVTDEENVFKISATIANGIATLERNDLVWGERTLEIRTKNCSYLLRVDVISKVLNNASEFINWKSGLRKWDEVTPEEFGGDYGYGYWKYDGYVILGADIKLKNNEISTLINKKDDEFGFQGIFDGRGHTVSGGLYSEGGIFGTLGKNGIIRNIALVGGTLDAWEGWDYDRIFAAVVADYTAGTVDNCLIDVSRLNAKSTKYDANGVFGYFAPGIIQNTVVYVSESSANPHYAVVRDATGATVNNLYCFIDSPKPDYRLWGLDWTPNDVSTVYNNDYTASIADTNMSEILTSEYWDFTGNKAAFKQEPIVYDMKAEYELYTAFNGTEKVKNTKDLTLSVSGLSGDVTIFIDKENMGITTVSNGQIIIPATKILSLNEGVFTLTLKESGGAFINVELTVYTAIITNATELVNWHNYTTKKEVTVNETTGYETWIYDGYFALGADIDLRDKVISTLLDAENGAYGFQGIFDGKGHAIRGGVYSQGGLFGAIGMKGVVMNVAFVGATLDAWANLDTGWDDSKIFASVFCDYMGGTIENCLVSVSRVNTVDATYQQNTVFGVIVAGTIKDTVVYVKDGYNNYALAYNAKNATVSNLYSFVQSGWEVGRMWVVGFAPADVTTVYDNAYATAISETNMTETLTSEYWDLTGDQACFKSKEIIYDAEAEYELYTSLTGNEKVANTEALTVSAFGLTGEVEIWLDGENIGSTTVLSEKIAISSEIIFDHMLGGTYRITFIATNGASINVELTIYTAIITTAEELVNWQAYATKTDETDGNAYKKWKYDGYFALGADIDITGKIVTTKLDTENGNYGFIGTFDGRGHTITGGLYSEGGLFGAIGATGVVKNVAFVGGTLDAWANLDTGWDDSKIFASVFCDYMGGTIENCLVSVSRVNTVDSTYQQNTVFGAIVAGTIKDTVVYVKDGYNNYSLAYNAKDAMVSNLYSFVQSGWEVGRMWVVGFAPADVTTVYDNAYATAISETNMAETLTGEYWAINETNNTVLLQEKN